MIPLFAQRQKHWIVPSGALLGLALTGLSGCTATLPVGQPPATALPSLAPMVEKAAPAVVNIATESEITLTPNPLLDDPFFQRFFDLPEGPIQRRAQGLGSGVIIDARAGYIVTNRHVIDRATRVTITLHDGRRFEAELKGADPGTDIAVLRVAARRLTAMPLADSDQLRVGDFVVAIGNPFGLGQTVTAGIVSALGRSGLGLEGFEDFIQTDASINPGSSGGALVNLQGELVGINTAILAPSGGNVGINFAIPANLVQRLVNQLVRFGQIERGQLGVLVRDWASPRDRLDDDGLRGALISRIEPDSTAARAGLRVDDIVLGINGRPIDSAAALRNRIGLLSIGDRVELDILRQDQRLTLTTELGPGRISQ